ncbi:MAG: amidohydrolase family protein [Thermoplasmata archaeon]
MTDSEWLAIENATVLPAPNVAPIERCTVVARDGHIVAMGAGIPVPSGAQTIPGDGRFLMAGFWNAHVHFTERQWRSAAKAPSAVLDASLREMLTSRGFTCVVDTGSDPRITLPLARRVEAGELRGPAIVTAGTGLYPPRGLPYYLKGEIPFWVRPLLPQPATPAAAVRVVDRTIARGASLIKLFTGSYVARGKVVPMPEGVARAAVEAAHRHRVLVFSHPSNRAGTDVAVRSGVDVLAHPPDSTEGVDDALLLEIVGRRMAMIPTLKMFATTIGEDPRYLDPIYRVVRRFRELGGQLLFGTDVGFMPDYSTEGEYQALGRAGLDWPAVLAALTTAPAERFGVLTDRGIVSVGRRADLVLLDGDPRTDLLAFARVRATVRGGRVLFVRS